MGVGLEWEGVWRGQFLELPGHGPSPGTGCVCSVYLVCAHFRVYMVIMCYVLIHVTYMRDV